MKRISWLKVAVQAALLSSFLLAAGTFGAQFERPEKVPAFTLSDLDGNQISLADYHGQVVLINFWATWCSPCVEELPTMEELRKSLADKPFGIIAINLSEDAETIRSFLERHSIELNFPLVLDAAGETAEKYHVRGLPATMIVDREGKFVFGGVGQRDWNSPAVRMEILPQFD